MTILFDGYRKNLAIAVRCALAAVLIAAHLYETRMTDVADDHERSLCVKCYQLLHNKKSQLKRASIGE